MSAVIDIEALAIDPKTDAIGTEFDRSLAFPDESKRPCYRVYQSFCGPVGDRGRTRKPGVYFHGITQANEKKPPELVDYWLCSPLVILAETRDSKSGAWGRFLEWYDRDKVRHQWAMPINLLHGDGVEVRKELAYFGLDMSLDYRDWTRLAGYIKDHRVYKMARCVERLGWHQGAYVTPAEVIGKNEGELLVFQNPSAVEPALSQSGTAASWRDSVARLAAGNSRLVFAVSVGFAGPLLDLVGEDSGGFHLVGGSSSGKATAMIAAASVWGDPAVYVRQWRATANGLEGLAAMHNDGLLLLDEISQGDAREASETVYMLGNGKGKSRANRSGMTRPGQSWRLMFMSSGETSLAAHVAKAGKSVQAGQAVRLADVEIDAGKGLRGFECLHECASASAFSDAVKRASGAHYGAVGMDWLRLIVPIRDRLAEDIREGVRQFVEQAVPAGADGQVMRVAKRFALVAVAGELARQLELTGWPEGEASNAAGTCFQAWMSGFGGIGCKEERDLLSQVKRFFEQHGSSRFESLDSSEVKTINRAGYRRGDEWLVFPETFKSEICAGHDVRMAVPALIRAGWLIPGSDGRPKQKVYVGTSQRPWVYVISSAMLGGD